MLVIMDIEWIVSNYRICPTQLSAMRVDSNWRVADQFNRLIQPFSPAAQQWEHVAYTGYLPGSFLSAQSAAMVFNKLNEWLWPGDVLCWWSEPTAAAFIALHRVLIKSEPAYQMRLISPALASHLKGIKHPKRSAYYLSEKLGIPLFEQEHCSADDVRVVRNLLQHLNVNQDSILASHVPLTATTQTMKQLLERPKKHEKQSSLKVSGITGNLEYVIDITDKLVHARECSKINDSHELKEAATWKAAFRHHCTPCKCCRDAYWEFSRTRSAQNIKSMQLSFVFSPSGLFHKPSCMHVKWIPYSLIKGAIYYRTCIEQGYKPCGWCNPKPDDGREPHHTGQWPVNGYGRVNRTPTHFGDNPWATTRALTRYEKNAIKRHEAAVRERAEIPDDLSEVDAHDAFILAQSGYAFWAAEGYQTFHLRSCPKLAHISYLHGYSRFIDAQRRGLVPCKLCKPSSINDILESVPINQKMRESESISDIDRLCEQLGWKHHNDQYSYSIETLVGKWRMIPGTIPLEVYHINKVHEPDNSNNYHKQHRLFLSMTDTIEYIRRHDDDLRLKTTATTETYCHGQETLFQRRN